MVAVRGTHSPLMPDSGRLHMAADPAKRSQETSRATSHEKVADPGRSHMAADPEEVVMEMMVVVVMMTRQWRMRQ